MPDDGDVDANLLEHTNILKGQTVPTFDGLGLGGGEGYQSRSREWEGEW